MLIHNSWIRCWICLLDFESSWISHLFTKSRATLPHSLSQIWAIKLSLALGTCSWIIQIFSFCISGGGSQKIVVTSLLWHLLSKFVLTHLGVVSVDSFLHFFWNVLVLYIFSKWRIPLLILRLSIPRFLSHGIIFWNVWHAFNLLELIFVIGLLHFWLSGILRIQTILVALHCLGL